MEPSRITNISINGFRSLRNVNWEPGALNVIIGYNASGKSNLLKCLKFIWASSSGQLRESVDSQGGMGSLVWGGRDRDVMIALSNAGEASTELHFRYVLHIKRFDNTSDYRIAAESCEVLDQRSHKKFVYDRENANLHSVGLSENTISAFRSVVSSPETLLCRVSSPFVTETLLQRVQSTLSSFLILDDFHTDSGAALRQPVTSRIEVVLSQNGQNLPEVLHSLYTTHYEFKERIDTAMSAVFGDAYKELAFPPGAVQQIQLGVRWAALQRPETAANLSDGTLRFLFIIAALSLPDPPSVIAIDEPETGLHPTMMRVIAEYAADAALRSQIIFTTHSIAFLDGFSKDDPPTVTVAEMQNGESTLKVIDPELLSRWLTNYTLGGLYRSKELEQMMAAPAKKESAE